MYATLPLKRLLGLLGYPLLAIFVLLLAFGKAPADAAALFGVMGKAIAIWLAALAAFGGSAKWWSPWRLLWKLIPPLNQLVFPDLNGKWRGTTRSNWPSIKAMLDAVDGKGTASTSCELATIPLKEDAIEIEIRASLLRFIVFAKLSATDGSSASVTETLRYNDRLEQFELTYVYQQETPVPVITDEATHPGAATLRLSMEDGAWRLAGNYWTRRSWRSGLNTAGTIEVERVSR